MNDYHSRSPPPWECKSPVVFLPTYRRTGLSGQRRQYRGPVFRERARHQESLSEEGHLQAAQVHLLLSLPPTEAVAQGVGDVKGKRASPIAPTEGGRECNVVGAQCWARGYLVSTGAGTRPPSGAPSKNRRRRRSGWSS
jgi:REP element-mobilizing transposase RayT